MDPTATITDVDGSKLDAAEDVALTLTVAVEHDGTTYVRRITYRLPDVLLNTTTRPPTVADVKRDVVAQANAVRQLKDLAAQLDAAKGLDLVAAAAAAADALAAKV